MKDNTKEANVYFHIAVLILVVLGVVGCTQEIMPMAKQVSWSTGNSQNSTYLPNPQLTPGAIDPRVTQDNIQQTICVSGYTATVRPPSSFTTKLKMQQIQQYGFSDINLSDYEEDHLISLELGGCPDCPENLWPEAYNIQNGARVKDQVENKLHTLVCNGQLSLADAQQAIASNWYSAYQRYVVG